MASVRAQRWWSAVGEWWAGVWRWVIMAVGVVIVVRMLLETRGNSLPMTATALAALIVAVVLTFSKPLAIALMALPALFITERLGMGDTDLSVSDAALAAAFGSAILLGDRSYSRPMRWMLGANLIYQFATVFTVIVNPNRANTTEWFHAWMLITGALIVGWALGRGGYARTALVLMVVGAFVIAAGTIGTGLVNYVHGNFTAVYPTWPWLMQKNTAGTLMSFALLILYVNPPWAGFRKAAARTGILILAIAIVMTQSRQALIGLIVAILIVVARRGRTGHSPWTFLLAIPGIWLIVWTIVDQVNSQNEFNSLFQRLNWVKELYAYFKTSPLLGHGLRFWYFDPTVPYQPPQAELEVLTSAGLVGLVGFAAMWLIFVVVLWRIDPLYGTLALAATGSRLVQAQFDLFWVAAQVSVPFVIAGICLGAMARGRASGPPPADESAGAHSDAETLEPAGLAVASADQVPADSRGAFSRRDIPWDER